ncbi:MAG: glycosyltransferase family 2 protein [Nanoarchaeota archaeon]|nr:glycosyltransferase family 2 protein [Nanoarchaeota archaeon]
MKISVIVATYNRKELLKKLIDSLLNQNYEDYEIIIVDDGSNDGTKEMLNGIKNKKLKFITQENLYPAVARNNGVKISKGEIIVFTDDDCIANKNWLKEIKKCFEENKDIIAVEGKTTSFDTTPFTKQVINEKGRRYATCNMAVYKKTFLEINGFDEDYPFGTLEDQDLAARILREGKIKFCDRAIIVHPPMGGKIVENKNILLRPIKTYKEIIDKFYKIHRGDFLSHLRLYKKCPEYYKSHLGRNPFISFMKITFWQPLYGLNFHKKYFLKNPSKIIPYLFNRFAVSSMTWVCFFKYKFLKSWKKD